MACEEAEETVSITSPPSQPTPLTLSRCVLSLTCLTEGKGTEADGCLEASEPPISGWCSTGKEIMKPSTSEQHLSDFPMRYQRVFGAIGHKVAEVFNVPPGSGFLHDSAPGKRDCLISTSSLSPICQTPRPILVLARE